MEKDKFTSWPLVATLGSEDSVKCTFNFYVSPSGFICDPGVRIFSVTAPFYIVETFPANQRHRAVSLCQFNRNKIVFQSAIVCPVRAKEQNFSIEFL
ncbi:hypothetical protein [Terrimonas alba]|uniref:hypothetical protein n=1 Tax=Terrimonas alba TaxID=3349636 RepID=UPI0035F27377